MSVMTSRETSTGGPDRGEHAGIDAWALCAEFVEHMLSDALAAAARADPGRSVPDVDWDRIWRSAEGAPSDEAAIGRVVRAASEVARELALGTTEAFPPTPARVDPEVRAEPELTLPPPVVSAPDAPVEPPKAETEPVTVKAETLAGRQEPVTAQTEPVVVVEEPVTARRARRRREEPVTAPVILATSAVGSVTLDRPDPGAVTVAEPAHDGQLLTAPTVLAEPEQATVAAKPAVSTRVSTHAGWFSAFTWVRNIGAIVILFVVWQLWGTAIAQHQDQSQLKAAFEAALRAHHLPKATAAGPSLIPATTRVPPPADGSVVAEVQIPAIGVDQYVVEGTSSTNLSKGPGHYVGTAAPGQAGNVAIAGHRTTHGAPFNRLGELRRGDRIVLTSTSGQHLTYVVSGSPQAVSPSDVGVLNYFGDNRITLTTCTPEFSAAQRLIAVGELRQSVRQAPAASEARHVPPRRHGHRQLGVVVAPGGGDRGLPPGAPRDVLPAIRLLVRACRPVVHPAYHCGLPASTCCSTP